MGYNRGGTRRTARLKRRKRLETRLAKKAATEQATANKGKGLTDKA
jgi:hypothetical protein